MKNKKGPQYKAVKSLSIKSVNEEENIIEGYASTFGGEPDAYGDVVVKGAFAKTINENGDRIKFLDGHDWNKVIGKVTEVYEDNYGLYIKAKISDTVQGRDFMTLAKDGVIDRMSIGYIPIKYEWNEEGTLFLKEIKLLEVSGVGLPANDNAVITSAKDFTGENGKEFMVQLKAELKKELLEEIKAELTCVKPGDKDKEESLENVKSLVEQLKSK